MKNNLQKKLWESGLIKEGNTEKIKAFKEIHKKERNRDYNADYNKRVHRKIMNFTKGEIQYLNEQAEKYNFEQLSPFLKFAIFAFSTGVYISPEKEDREEISMSIREMKNRVLDSIKYVYLNNTVTSEDIQGLITAINSLEISLDDKLNSVKSLREWIQKQIEKDPLFISKLLQTISELLKNDY